jgi:hypothetical protein
MAATSLPFVGLKLANPGGYNSCGREFTSIMRRAEASQIAVLAIPSCRGTAGHFGCLGDRKYGIPIAECSITEHLETQVLTEG